MKAFDPKWVNSILDIIIVNSLRVEALQVKQIVGQNLVLRVSKSYKELPNTNVWLWMEDFEPKWVNSDYILYGVNSLRLGGLKFIYLYILFTIIFIL